MVTRCCEQLRCVRHNWPEKKKGQKKPTPKTNTSPKPQLPAPESFANKCCYQSYPGLARLSGDWAGVLWTSDWDNSWTHKMWFISSWSRTSSDIRGIELPRTIAGLLRKSEKELTLLGSSSVYTRLNQFKSYWEKQLIARKMNSSWHSSSRRQQCLPQN